MKRIEQRRLRLLKDHIPAFEARQLSRLVEYTLAGPVLKKIRSERKKDWRASKRAGIGRRDFNRKVAFAYEVEGFKARGKYQVGERMRQISRERVVAKAIRMLRISKTTPAGRLGRLHILEKAGFFPWEARILATMKDVRKELRRHTFLSKPWQSMIKNHKAHVAKMMVRAKVRLRKQIGPTAFNLLSESEKNRRAKKLLSDMLRRLYTQQKYSVYDWLKREYRPKTKPRAYQVTQRTRAKGKTDKLLKAKTVAFFD